MFVQVLVELKAKQIAKTFTYSVPEELQKQIEIGKRVSVPFGHQQLEGFILKLENHFTGDYEVKKIISVIDEQPVLNKELLDLGNYISKKTLCNLIHAYQTMLPVALKAKKNTNISRKYEKYIIWNNKNYDENTITKVGRQILNRMDTEEKVLKKELASGFPPAYGVGHAGGDRAFCDRGGAVLRLQGSVPVRQAVRGGLRLYAPAVPPPCAGEEPGIRRKLSNGTNSGMAIAV